MPRQGGSSECSGPKTFREESRSAGPITPDAFAKFLGHKLDQYFNRLNEQLDHMDQRSNESIYRMHKCWTGQDPKYIHMKKDFRSNRQTDGLPRQARLPEARTHIAKSPVRWVRRRIDRRWGSNSYPASRNRARFGSIYIHRPIGKQSWINSGACWEWWWQGFLPPRPNAQRSVSRQES